MVNDLTASILEQLYFIWREKGGSEGVQREELARALDAEVGQIVSALDLLRLDALAEPLTMRRVRITEAGIERHEQETGVQEDDAQARRKILDRLGREFLAKGSRGIAYLKPEEFGLDTLTFERNCWYLARSGLIEAIGIGSVYRITAAGLNRLETAASRA